MQNFLLQRIFYESFKKIVMQIRENVKSNLHFILQNLCEKILVNKWRQSKLKLNKFVFIDS